ncbi:unnamed protein product [Cuscuta europaea]|uniref:Uncharacterized protein n=1 Tax=Cuscuta europaea TaxID=41803 RepID=A0A9P1E5D2_CUSEU|nr:unnamed protein product [Cuscuta europaea]
MKRYYNPVEEKADESSSSKIVVPAVPSTTIQENSTTNDEEHTIIQSVAANEFDASQLPSDPGLRIPISRYHPNIRDQVRRAYLQKGPCQPFEHDFQMSCIMLYKGVTKILSMQWILLEFAGTDFKLLEMTDGIHCLRRFVIFVINILLISQT